MEIYVIDNSQTTTDVIIGTDVLKQTEFKISGNGIELLTKKEEHFINLINVPKAHIQSELKDNALEIVKPHDRYEVEEVGQHGDSYPTSTTVDFMKKWLTYGKPNDFAAEIPIPHQ
ncbi:hypothetical protein TNCT_419471 [Trichonephila clavata]|uniref:Uncharacterized protein n=1 Tax=Trichonephila clavata TaxID=2740835 RepID=A0A8X6L1S2_TRICU|nr:hypothetical protein TNCT_419471 [Trichonephila clavata]